MVSMIARDLRLSAEEHKRCGETTGFEMERKLDPTRDGLGA